MLLQRQIAFSAALGERLPACGILWWYIRLEDREGCGRAHICLETMAEELGRSVVTAKRWLRQCLALGIVRCGNGDVLHYSSMVKVAIARGVEDLGAVGWITKEDLTRLKFVAAELQAEYCQQQSWYAAREAAREETKQKKLKLPTVEDLFGPSGQCQGVHTIHIGKRCVFVSEDFVSFGASQDLIAAGLERCPKTIQRRLSNSYRAERSIAPLFKRQLAQRLVDTPSDWRRLAEDSIWDGDAELAGELVKRFNCKGRAYRAGCNLYVLPVELRGKRKMRSKLSRALDMGQS